MRAIAPAPGGKLGITQTTIAVRRLKTDLPQDGFVRLQTVGVFDHFSINCFISWQMTSRATRKSESRIGHPDRRTVGTQLMITRRGARCRVCVDYPFPLHDTLLMAPCSTTMTFKSPRRLRASKHGFGRCPPSASLLEFTLHHRLPSTPLCASFQ
jgi:hypothetical protein